MTDGIFLQGRLEMSSSPIQVEEALPLWGEILSNQILVAATVLLFVFMLKDILRLTPALVYMLQQKHGTQAFEYNISIARTRSLTALICIIPFCLIIDRFSLYRPEFMNSFDASWSAAISIAVFSSFLLLRTVLHSAVRPRRMHSDELASFNHSPYNYFILMVFAMVASSLLLVFFKIDTEAVRLVILIEIALFSFLSLIRSGQILRSYCGGLATILYLCALEIIPVAILVISAVVF